jgi:hypothetical protein
VPTELGEQLVEQEALPVAWLVPQVVVGIADQSLGLQHLFLDLREPAQISGHVASFAC